MDSLIQSFYQAAADTRLLEPALERWAARFQATAGDCVFYDGQQAVGICNSAAMREVGQAFIEQRLWENDARIPHHTRVPLDQFLSAQQYFSPELLENNEAYRMQVALGLPHMAGTVVRVPGTDYSVALTLDRTAEQGPFTAAELAKLTALRCHLAGAAQMICQLTHQRAQVATHALQGVGQAAAVLDRRGRIIGCNAPFDADFPQWAEQGAHGRIQLRERRAQAALAAALTSAHGDNPAPLIWLQTRSSVARQLQLRPLIGPASECLLGGHALLLVHQPATAAPLSSKAQLCQRYGLTEREADLADLLAQGGSLRQCAEELGLAYNSARTYLTRVHFKLGTHHQSELVRLVLGQRK